MRALAALLAALCLGACARTPDVAATEQAAPEGQLSPDGIARLHIGAMVDEARRATGQDFAFPANDLDATVCVELPYRTADGQTLLVMFEEGRATRVTAESEAPRVRTPEGVGVGSTDAEVRAAYPEALETPAKYNSAPAHDLVTWRAPNESGMRFEVDEHGVVTSIHAGMASILYVEGCS